MNAPTFEEVKAFVEKENLSAAESLLPLPNKEMRGFRVAFSTINGSSMVNEFEND